MWYLHNYTISSYIDMVWTQQYYLSCTDSVHTWYVVLAQLYYQFMYRHGTSTTILAALYRLGTHLMCQLSVPVLGYPHGHIRSPVQTQYTPYIWYWLGYISIPVQTQYTPYIWNWHGNISSAIHTEYTPYIWYWHNHIYSPVQLQYTP